MYSYKIDIRQWLYLHITRGEREACLVEATNVERLCGRVILEPTVQYFSHVILGHSNMKFEFFHVAWVR